MRHYVLTTSDETSAFDLAARLASHMGQRHCSLTLPSRSQVVVTPAVLGPVDETGAQVVITAAIVSPPFWVLFCAVDDDDRFPALGTGWTVRRAKSTETVLDTWTAPVSVQRGAVNLPDPVAATRDV